MINGNINNRGVGTLPHHFVTFVEIFFAVVLAASILEFYDVLFPPAITSLGFWALIIVYFTAISSWIGWHRSTGDFPYTNSRFGQIRSVLDAIIVGTYAALLYFGIKADETLLWYLWSFVGVFILYYIVGRVRCIEYRDSQASQPKWIIIHGAIAVAAAVAYTIIYEIIYQIQPESLVIVSAGFLLVTLLNVTSYRWFREWRRMPWTIKFTVAIDMDGVLVDQVPPILTKLNQEMGVTLHKNDITDWEYPIGGTNIKVEIERAEREEDFVRQMPSIENAKEALGIMSDKFTIIIATSRENCTDQWSLDWLNSQGIHYSKLINTRSQGKILPGIDILIDDYIGNIEKFIRNGPQNRQAILFAQPWNQDTSSISDLITSGRVKIANSWQTILTLLNCTLPEARSSSEQKRVIVDNSIKIPRTYLVQQSLTCFVASFLFIRGYNLASMGISSFIPIPANWHLSLGVIFIVLALYFGLSAFYDWLRHILEYILFKLLRLKCSPAPFYRVLSRVVNRMLVVLWFPVSITSVASVLINWIDGINLLEPGMIWHQFFFWAGLAFWLIFSIHFIYSAWEYRPEWRQ